MVVSFPTKSSEVVKHSSLYILETSQKNLIKHVATDDQTDLRASYEDPLKKLAAFVAKTEG